MCGKIGAGIVSWVVASSLAGCATTSNARYVYQDAEFGVVAIPKNTTDGRDHYREQAEALMARHFPEGYEIVRAEEVVEGSRTLTVGRAGTTEFAPQVSPNLLALLKVGGTRTWTQTDTTNLTECRIIYRKTDPGSTTAPGKFAPNSSATPTAYLDPNDEDRKPDKDKDKSAVQLSRASAPTEQKPNGCGAAGE